MPKSQSDGSQLKKFSFHDSCKFLEEQHIYKAFQKKTKNRILILLDQFLWFKPWVKAGTYFIWKLTFLCTFPVLNHFCWIKGGWYIRVSNLDYKSFNGVAFSKSMKFSFLFCCLSDNHKSILIVILSRWLILEWQYNDIFTIRNICHLDLEAPLFVQRFHFFEDKNQQSFQNWKLQIKNLQFDNLAPFDCTYMVQYWKHAYGCHNSNEICSGLQNYLEPEKLNIDYCNPILAFVLKYPVSQ